MDKLDKRDEILRTFLEYGIVPSIENDLTKNDLADCAEKIVKNLSLCAVSHQREQFINLLTSLEKEGGNKFVDKEWIVDNYLKIN
jgi:hypothetical protein